jgi:hypothetical protein
MNAKKKRPIETGRVCDLLRERCWSRDRAIACVVVSLCLSSVEPHDKGLALSLDA